MSPHFSWRRLGALCRKETWQIARDPSSGIVAFGLPMMLILIFGFGINLDTSRARVGVLNEDTGAESADFVQQITGSPYFEPRVVHDRPTLDHLLETGEVRGYVVVPADFSRRLEESDRVAPIQVVTDGAEPNTANFVSGYVSGAWREWQLARARERGATVALPLAVEPRYWFNPSAKSRNYLIPGSITIIMTVIGALLTSLVVAREWERGTMEALLASPVSRAEILLSKLLPYYLLGMLSMGVVTALAVFALGVPFRGSLFVLCVVTTFFLLSVMGLGLFISAKTRDQFNAAQGALNVAFLPAMMLSGFIFEITSMPAPIRGLTYLLPPRYFVSSLQTLFLAGDVWTILVPDTLFLVATSALFLFLAARATTRRLDG